MEYTYQYHNQTKLGVCVGIVKPSIKTSSNSIIKSNKTSSHND
jgi:hypothetical protein